VLSAWPCTASITGFSFSASLPPPKPRGVPTARVLLPASGGGPCSAHVHA
jgi:hypothetical protein